MKDENKDIRPDSVIICATYFAREGAQKCVAPYFDENSVWCYTFRTYVLYQLYGINPVQD